MVSSPLAEILLSQDFRQVSDNQRRYVVPRTSYLHVSLSLRPQNVKYSFYQEQDKSSDSEQQPPLGDRKCSNTLPQKRGIQNQREYHIILTKYEAMHPTYVIIPNQEC